MAAKANKAVILFFHQIKEHFLPMLKEDGKFYSHREDYHTFDETSCSYAGSYHNHDWEVEIKYNPEIDKIEGYYQIHTATPVERTFEPSEVAAAIEFMKTIIDK